MTRTEADLAAAIAAVTDELVVDTDAFVTTVKHRHRQRRRRQLALTAGAAAVVAVAASVPAALLAGPFGPDAAGPTAAPTGPLGGWATIPRTFTGACPVEAIPTPLDVEPGHPVWLTDVDPTGRFVVGTYGPPVGPDGSWGNSDGPTGRALPVRWDNGVGRVLPIGGEGLRNVRPAAVNRHGAVVGSLRRNDVARTVAWVSLDGTTWSPLPTPPGYDDAYAIGITDDNTVLGGA